MIDEPDGLHHQHINRTGEDLEVRLTIPTVLHVNPPAAGRMPLIHIPGSNEDVWWEPPPGQECTLTVLHDQVLLGVADDIALPVPLQVGLDMTLHVFEDPTHVVPVPIAKCSHGVRPPEKCPYWPHP